MRIRGRFVPVFFALLVFALPAPRCEGADVLIVGDPQLKPVSDIIAGMEKTLDASTKVYTPVQVKGALPRVAEEERARVVVALGRDALALALALPPSLPVIYGLVVTPPEIDRPNTTGFYMATPVRAYVDLANKHLHSLRRIAVVGTREQLSVLARDDGGQVASYGVKNAFEFVSAIRQLEAVDAVLLVPDAALLTTTAMEEAYLLSFRRGIPLLGISERQVKHGALLALVVDPVSLGRQIGEQASKAIRGMNVGHLPPSPPNKFDLYVNLDTAKRMGIRLPDELIRTAKGTYP